MEWGGVGWGRGGRSGAQEGAAVATGHGYGAHPLGKDTKEGRSWNLAKCLTATCRMSSGSAGGCSRASRHTIMEGGARACRRWVWRGAKPAETEPLAGLEGIQRLACASGGPPNHCRQEICAGGVQGTRTHAAGLPDSTTVGFFPKKMRKMPPYLRSHSSSAQRKWRRQGLLAEQGVCRVSHDKVGRVPFAGCWQVAD